MVLFALFLIVWIADSFILHLSASFTDHIPLYLRLILSAVLLALAVYLVKSGHTAVGHEGIPKAVIDTGAFRYVRHPLYLGSVLFYLSLVVSTASLLSFALWVVILVFYDYISCYEERVLEQVFGEEYHSYKSRTGRWIPRITSARIDPVESHSYDEEIEKQNREYTSGA